MAVQLVWFKRDLRIRDHRPLVEASKQGPCIFLYVYEPEILEQEEYDASHFQFAQECLIELENNLAAIGGRLIYRKGNAPEVLKALHKKMPFEALWSHEETGNWKTYQRDERVRRWAKGTGIVWHEFPQTGVVRRLKERDGWSRLWNQRMKEPVLDPPLRIETIPSLRTGKRRSAKEFGLPETDKSGLQRGGESVAVDTLNTFLRERGVNYRFDMSSPVTAWEGCSRLSPYIAFGAISMKTVFHRLEDRRDELRAAPKSDPENTDSRWLQSLSSFAGRLRWHCHFIQKLEDEPRIEFENMARCYDGLREDEWNQEYFEAWCAGHTGYPMVDACMRALHQRSWINFRMRAMLTSFSSYDLWLHWRKPAVYLAKHFLDFEPGIHFSQTQMQSGTTGINTMRIYSPAKQVKDQDPDGAFIREWLPELDGVPNEHLAEPHKMPLDVQRKSGCIIGKHYPRPIVNHQDAVREARRRMSAVRRSKEAQAEAKWILSKHGSRRKTGRKKTKR